MRSISVTKDIVRDEVELKAEFSLEFNEVEARTEGNFAYPQPIHMVVFNNDPFWVERVADRGAMLFTEKYGRPHALLLHRPHGTIFENYYYAITRVPSPTSSYEGMGGRITMSMPREALLIYSCKKRDT